MTRIGIVGAGSIASHHVQAARKVGLEVVAVCGRPDSKRAERFAQQNKCLFDSNLEKLLERDLDGIVIATSISETSHVLEEVIKREVPILVEKPVTTNLNEMRRLSSIGNQVRVGYNRRYYSSVQDARSILQQTPGGVFDVFIPELSLASGSKKEDFDLSVLENGIHMVDLTRYLFGEILNANTVFSSFTDGLQAVCLSVVTETGLRGTIRCFGGVPENYSINYWNASTSVELKPIEFLNLNHGMELEEANSKFPFKRYRKNTYEWNLHDADIETKPGFALQYQEFKNFILGIPEGIPLPTLSDAYKSLYWAKRIIFQDN